MKLHNPMIVQSVCTSNGVNIVFNPSMGTNDDPGIENLSTDLLVLTQMSNAHMSQGTQKIDKKLGGTISKAIAAQGFTGQAAETILLDCAKFKNEQRYVLLVGLGDPAHFKGYTVCGLMRTVLETARELGVAKITMPIFPNRQTEDELTLAGTAAIMSCRVSTFGKLPKLEEIELFCTPQARRHLQGGLICKVPHCENCANPKLEDQK
jgi:hypothetical protein